MIVLITNYGERYVNERKTQIPSTLTRIHFSAIANYTDIMHLFPALYASRKRCNVYVYSSANHIELCDLAV